MSYPFEYEELQVSTNSGTFVTVLDSLTGGKIHWIGAGSNTADNEIRVTIDGITETFQIANVYKTITFNLDPQSALCFNIGVWGIENRMMFYKNQFKVEIRANIAGTCYANLAFSEDV